MPSLGLKVNMDCESSHFSQFAWDSLVYSYCFFIIISNISFTLGSALLWIYLPWPSYWWQYNEMRFPCHPHIGPALEDAVSACVKGSLCSKNSLCWVVTFCWQKSITTFAGGMSFEDTGDFIHHSLSLSEVPHEKVLFKQPFASCKELRYFFLSGYKDSIIDHISLFSLAARKLRYKCAAEL